jgi:hypothetical protein
MIAKAKLEKLYKRGLSIQEIADQTDWSYHQVVYWMDKHNIHRRSRSEANYVKYNPDGDPFRIKKNLTKKEIALKGLGVGIYWGEGNRRSKYSVKVGNTDPNLIKKFIEFLVIVCSVRGKKIKYSLQIFNDGDSEEAVDFWSQKLNVPKEEIGNPSILPPMGKGTYKKKSKYGVLTVYVHNVKLKKIFDEWIREMAD